MKKAATIVAVAAALVVVGGATVVGLTGGSADSFQQQTTNTGEEQQVDSKCGLPGTSGEPKDLPASWENVVGWSLPISPTDGPGTRDPVGSWSCFSRTHSGAVLAGYTIAMRADGLAEDWQTVVREQTVPGPEQQSKLDSIPPAQTETVQLRGFKVVAYTDDQATIAYYLHTSTLELSCTADLVWMEQDWRLKLHGEGDTLSSCSQGVPESFVPWGPPA